MAIFKFRLWSITLIVSDRKLSQEAIQRAMFHNRRSAEWPAAGAKNNGSLPRGTTRGDDLTSAAGRATHPRVTAPHRMNS